MLNTLLNTPMYERMFRRQLADALGFERTGGSTMGAVVRDVGLVRGVRTSLYVGCIALTPKKYGRAAPPDPNNLSLGGSLTRPMSVSTQVRVLFPSPLDLGWRVDPLGPPAGRTHFDEVFRVTTRDPDRVPLPAEVQGALVAAHIGEPGVTVDDTAVSLEVNYTTHDQTYSSGPIAAAVLRLVDVVPVLVAQARDLPPTRAMRPVMDELGELPLPDGIARITAPHGIAGRVGDLDVVVAVAPSAGGWGLRCSVALPTTVAATASSERRRGGARRAWDTLFRAADPTVGDAEFDERFYVVGDVQALAEVLDADVRAAMVALDALVPVQLGRTAITASGVVADVRQVRDVAYCVLALAAFLAD